MAFEPQPRMIPWDPPHQHPATVAEITTCVDAVVLAACHGLITPEQSREIRYGYAQKMRLILVPAMDRLERVAAALEKKLADPALTGQGAAAIGKQLRGLAKDLGEAMKP